MGLFFEWDGAKAESNRRKHGVTFGEAASIFGDQLLLTDTVWETIWMKSVFSVSANQNGGRLLVVSHLEVDSVIRIISARTATASERKSYERR